jgi:hypothetical protein
VERLSDDQIYRIASQVFSSLTGKTEVIETADNTIYSGDLPAGVFPDIESAVNAALVAQKNLMDQTLERRDKIIASI